MDDVTGIKGGVIKLVHQSIARWNFWNLGATIAEVEKLNDNEESCILGVMVHQTLLLNFLDHTGMEYVLPYGLVNPFVSVGYSPYCQI